MSQERDAAREQVHESLLEAIQVELRNVMASDDSMELAEMAEKAAARMEHVPLADRIVDAVKDVLHEAGIEFASSGFGALVEAAAQEGPEQISENLSRLTAALSADLGVAGGELARAFLESGGMDLLCAAVRKTCAQRQHGHNDARFHEVVEQFVNDHAADLPQEKRDELLCRGVDIMAETNDVMSLYQLLDSQDPDGLSPEELSRQHVDTYFPNASAEEKGQLVQQGIEMFGEQTGLPDVAMPEFEPPDEPFRTAFEDADDDELPSELVKVVEDRFVEEPPGDLEAWADVRAEEVLLAINGEGLDDVTEVTAELTNELGEIIDSGLQDGLVDAEASEIERLAEIADEVTTLDQLEQAADVGQGLEDSLGEIGDEPEPDLAFKQFEEDLTGGDMAGMENWGDAASGSLDQPPPYEEPPPGDES